MSKKIIITGVTGQIASKLVKYLLKNTDLEIIGTIRRLSVNNHRNLDDIEPSERFRLEQMDLSDPISICSLIEREKPEFFVNCAANSFVGTSWIYPVQHMEINAVGVLHQLDAIRKYSPHTRYLNMGSSEEFGDVKYSPQDENHPLSPRSPYGASKCSARFITKIYRESYNLFAVQPWNFNTESSKRGSEFLTRKVTLGVARIKHSIENKKDFEPICVGNISARRDWQSASDCCEALWLMLNQEKPTEYVIGSGETHSVREFIELAFKEAGIEGHWSFQGTVGNYVPPENEIFIESGTRDVLVKIDTKFCRPAEVDLLWADPSRIKKELGWWPKVSFNELIKEMVESDYNLLTKK